MISGRRIYWGLTKGQDYLDALFYARLSQIVVSQQEKAIARIKLNSTDVALQTKPLYR